MHHGYLAVETHSNRPGMIRLFSAERPPVPDGTDAPQPRVRYVARFNDGEAALMHTHEYLKRRLADPDSRLYRVPLERAIAAVEAVELRHREIYIDPELDQETRGRIDAERARLQRIASRRRHFFEGIGYIGIGLLLFNLFVLSFA